MDERLVAWARAVKARQAKILPGHDLPVLWLFTDAMRLPDPSAAVARLPRGLCGVVLRHDGVADWDAADRAALGRRLAGLCRARRNVLVVAGDWRLAAALRAGVHLRGGRRLPMPRHSIRTSSAHGVAELVAARRAGAALVFLSPAFATVSHPGAAGLGPARWSGQVLRTGVAAAALGGVTGANVRRLGRRWCVAVGAIGALA